MLWRKTRFVNNRRKLLLVFRRVEASVKRGCPNPSLVFVLSLTRLFDNDVGIAQFAIHQVVVTYEACTVFKH